MQSKTLLVACVDKFVCLMVTMFICMVAIVDLSKILFNSLRGTVEVEVKGQ